ncbi:subtilisin family serine protease [Actinomyces sp. 2119]|nr:subtilisin family serine protease [Actinomyces sp. 2119]
MERIASSGRTAVRAVDRAAHGGQLLDEIQAAFSSADVSRAREDVEDILSATGTCLTLEGPGAKFSLQLDRLTSLAQPTRTGRKPRWLLLSVHPATKTSPELAVIWVADEFRAEFIQLFEDYLDPKKDGTNKKDGSVGSPRNNELVANIARVRTMFLEDLWTSGTRAPGRTLTWWELWLDPRRERPGLLDRVLGAYGLERLDRRTQVRDAVIVYVRATWEQLEPLTATDLPLTEIRRPSFMTETTEDLDDEEQVEWVLDLLERLEPAPEGAPTVCHLDTGVFRGHRLIKGSLSSDDQHALVGSDPGDRHGHGTAMAGIGLYGPHLEELLLGTQEVHLLHRLESVRIIAGAQGGPWVGQRDYASATIEAVSLPEIKVRQPRVFCMPVSAKPDAGPGEPTLWSAAVDALAVGTDIVVEDDVVKLLSGPDRTTSRLIIVSAANVDEYTDTPLDNSDTSAVEDPGQSWNALTVGAFTDLDMQPADPTFRHYRPLATAGELSPHSRTSLLFGDRPWPIKPEICLEGGNVLFRSREDKEPKHPLLSLRSVGIRNDVTLASANATSAATAQAARLAALAMARYPSYWPETVRALLVHEAAWTSVMRKSIEAAGKKGERARLLRRYGWGVPTEDSVLSSSQTAVTMVVQDEFRPIGENFRLRELRLHSLPWPREVLQDLGGESVCLRVTLSYFIEPSATRRGWKGKYAYASHGLRFDLQAPTEGAEDFLRRVNRQASDEESGRTRGGGSSTSDRWFLGPQARHTGSLHQDEWTGTGADLAACNHVAVYPVGGWWKNNKRQDRQDLPVRYALLISLTAREQGMDLYTPVATQLQLPVEAVEVET